MTMGLVQHLLPGYWEPDVAFTALFAEESHAVWFDHHGERGTGVSYLAQGTPLVLDSANWEDVLRKAHLDRALPSGVALGEVPLGLVLVMPYELAATTLELQLPGAEEAVPIALAIDRVLELDHRSKSATLYGLGDQDDPEWLEWVSCVERCLRDAAPLPEPVLAQAQSLAWRDSTKRYCEIIREAQSAIREGDAYQLCVTTQITVLGAVDPIVLHRVMRRDNPTHHQALLRLGEISIVSASPETFINLAIDRTLSTRPIKGTRPRGATETEDEALAHELLSNDKERAENLMIVDLMRNDLSRVCEVGSVSVPELLSVETYTSVHQLVSTVSGTLLADADLMDVIRWTFPAGSMTGAPKHKAVQLVAAWEKEPRGYYSGAFGVWRADGSAFLAMTIRSAVVGHTSLTLGVGGGITALSDPAAEIAEVGVKALPFLRALGLQQVQYS